MEIQIAIEHYDDLFSDFDVRDYRERPFSRDFLDELNLRMTKSEDAGAVVIVFLLSVGVRNGGNEGVITERLERFFVDRYAYYCAKNARTILRSAIFVGIGLLILVGANAVSGSFPSLFKDFILIPSWYFVWAGLEQYVESRESINQKKKYYKKLEGAKVVFRVNRDSAASAVRENAVKPEQASF